MTNKRSWSATLVWGGMMLAVFLLLGLGASVKAEEDMSLPGDEATINLGKERYGAKCGGFCHGSLGKGGRAPCLVCGRFKRGAANTDLVRNISQGIAGTPMGAFGEVYSREEIVAIVAFLRAEQKRREADGN